MPYQFAGPQFGQAANKVSIDVVGVVFVFGKRAIGKHFADTCLPELPRESLKVANQFGPSWRVPRGVLVPIARPPHQQRLPQVLERDLVIARRQEAIRPKRWNRCHTCHSPHTYNISLA